MPKGHSDGARVGIGEFELVGNSAGHLRTRFLLQIAHDVPHVLTELRETVKSDARFRVWLKKYHFEDDWLQDVASRTRAAWLPPDDERLGRLEWASMTQKVELVPEGPLPAEPLEWDPLHEPEQSFRCRVDAYIASVKGWATSEANGGRLRGTPQKRNLGRDFSALVQYHVKGDDLAAVADEWFPDDTLDAARKALSSLASLIDLTLRKEKRGSVS